MWRREEKEDRERKWETDKWGKAGNEMQNEKRKEEK